MMNDKVKKFEKEIRSFTSKIVQKDTKSKVEEPTSSRVPMGFVAERQYDPVAARRTRLDEQGSPLTLLCLPGVKETRPVRR